MRSVICALIQLRRAVPVMAVTMAMLGGAASAETRALVVGIGHYESAGLPAIHADTDARAFAEALVSAGISNVTTLTDEAATKTAILTWFFMIQSSVKPEDLVILYFAGHGGEVEDPTGREPESTAFYPYDVETQPAVLGGVRVLRDRAITDDELGEWVVSYLFGANVVALLDACHSGGMAREADAGLLSVRGEGALVSRGLITAVRQSGDGGSTLFLASCRENERSWELPDRVPAGIFTTYLIEGMICAADQLPKDGTVTFAELADYVTIHVSDFVARTQRAGQNPYSEASPSTETARAIPLFRVEVACDLVSRALGLPSAIAAEEPPCCEQEALGEVVAFVDPELECAVRQRLGNPSGPIIRSEVERITDLRAPGRGIVSLQGLEALASLEFLDLRSNSIADLSPLAALRRLKTLAVSGNPIRSLAPLAAATELSYLDVSSSCGLHDRAFAMQTMAWGSALSLYSMVYDLAPLANLRALTFLDLSGNAIADLAPLAYLAQLKCLSVAYTEVSDVSALACMTRMESLDLSHNRISDITVLAGMPDMTTLNVGGNEIRLYPLDSGARSCYASSIGG